MSRGEDECRRNSSQGLQDPVLTRHGQKIPQRTVKAVVDGSEAICVKHINTHIIQVITKVAEMCAQECSRSHISNSPERRLLW